jgi:glycosyltransferase involved in cell wall biosynthesis
MEGVKQRVLLIARSLQMGGIERNTVNLANSMADSGHEVHILVLKRRVVLKPDPKVYLHYFDVDKINRMTGVGLVYDIVTRTFIAPFIRRSSFYWRGLYGGWYLRLFLLWQQHKYGRFDKIIARGQGAFELFWNFHDPRFYQVVVSPLWEMKGGFWERIFSRSLYENKNLVANSSGVLASLKERIEAYNISPRSINLIYNPLPVASIQKQSEEDANLPDEPYIVHVSRLTYQKNQSQLLRAYQASGVKEKLVIVGSGKDEGKLRRLASELGIADKVVFAGQQENPYPWMRGARLFVLSSRFEGFGLVLVEAMICGTPVVATDCPGGVHDLLTGDQKRLIAENSVQGLALKIREGIENPPVITPDLYQRFDAAVIAAQFLKLH